jgi:hypothetical protein
MLELDPDWEYVADVVMGGRSTGELVASTSQGRSGMRLRGDVSLDNNGGFIQMAFDLRPDGSAFDASFWRGIELDVFCNDQAYDLRLRTDQLDRPWQSFRTDFIATAQWSTLRFDFADFQPHRTEVTLDVARLRRIGILAIGRRFRADIVVANVRLYK